MRKVAEILRSHSEILCITNAANEQYLAWVIEVLVIASSLKKLLCYLFTTIKEETKSGEVKPVVHQSGAGGPMVAQGAWIWFINLVWGASIWCDLVCRSGVGGLVVVDFLGWFGLDMVDFFGLGWFLWWLLWWLAVVGMICLEWVAVAYGGFLGWFLEREKILFKG